MALVLNDRVKETTTTTGTGAIALGGAVSSFETFGAGVGNSNTTYYAIVHQTANEFEVGLGTLDGTSANLTRTTVISSSNSDAAVNFSAGTKDVFCTFPASKTMDMVMTTTGDIAYASANNTPARLALGTANQVLQVNSGATAPEWVTQSAGVSGGNDYYLAKNVSIPQGSSIEFIDGGAKVVLLTGDAVKVSSDTASSADCWLSYIDSIST